MATTITDAQDRRNISLIRHSMHQFFFRHESPNEIWLLEEGTPEERAEYVRKKSKRILIVAGIVAAYFIGSYIVHRNDPLPPPPPAPVVTSAGQVQGIQLHETAFSTSTTVITSTGIYQVRGGVSATIGDVTTLKKVNSQIAETSLCVDSKIQTQCYRLL